MIGSSTEYDALYRRLAAGAHCAVAYIGYRLAREHRFPAALQDCYRAVSWLSARVHEYGIDGARMGVLGESAGGNLAAALTLLARDRGGPQITCQCLVYPVTDLAMDSTSYRLLGVGYGLTASDLRWFQDHYPGSEKDIRNPLVSPLRARRLGNLPSALVMTSEFDPLRDEGEAYSRRLAAEDVPALLVRVPGVIHGFLDHADSVDVAGARSQMCAHTCARCWPAGYRLTRRRPGNALCFGDGGDISCDHDAH